MSIRYRPEVDGLRAISVVAIIIYHAEFLRGGYNLIPGAFLAVEVFFVISGFLITSLILKELEESGSFSVRGFYERRIRRLFPALVVILAATAIGAWFVLLPAQMVDFAKSLLASLFFVSNFYWDLSLQEYGADSGLLKPLLHTWTLAVEEQFYIVFPFMFVAFYRWFGRALVWWLWGVFLLSLCFAHWYTGVNAHSSFYMLASRYWELMAGAILAVLIHKLPAYDSNTPLKWVMSTVGLAILLSSFVVFNFKEAHHPGFMTMYAVLGTVLVIGFGGGRDPVTRLLSSRPFVLTGIMSYSLYLWHFPLFAYARHLNADVSSLEKLILIAVTFVLSFFSYRYIEKPFRSRRSMSTRKVLGIVAAFSMVIVAFSLWAIRGDGLRERFTQLDLLYGVNEFDNTVLEERTWSILNGLAAEHGLGESLPLEPSEFESTKRWFSDDVSTKKILVVGVSVSRDFFNALYLNVGKFTGMEFARFGMNSEIKPDQLEILFAAPNFLAADIVVLNFAMNDKYLSEHVEMVERVIATGKEVYITSNPQIYLARGGKGPFDWSMAKAAEGSETDIDFDSIYFESRMPLGSEVDPLLRNVAETHGLKFLDVRKLVCDESLQRCDGVTPAGYKTYYDNVHWTLEGAEHFGAKMARLGWFTKP